MTVVASQEDTSPNGIVTELSAAEVEASNRARASGQRVQVESLTSETTLVWALPEGGFEATFSAGVERFRRDGVWVDVDYTLVKRADGSIAPKGHPKDLVLSGTRAESGDLASIAVDNGRVGLGWSGALPDPVLVGARATYPEALPGIDLVVEATADGFEQFFIVKTAAAVPQAAELRLPLTGDAMASAVVEASGAVSLRGRGGTEIARMPVAQMWDSRPALPTGEPARATVVPTTTASAGAARAAGAEAGATGKASAASADTELVMAPDTQWMSARETVFPVVIDPTVVAPSVAFDTYVLDGDTTPNYANNDIWWGQLSSTKLARGYVHWNTSVLAGKQITASTVSFWDYWANGCPGTAGLDWQIWSTDPATNSTISTNQPAWRAGPHATSVSTAGGTNCADGWITIDGKNFFQYAADRALSVAPMGVRAANENLADPTGANAFKQVRSTDGTAASEDPKATVTYNAYPQVTARSTTPTTTCVTGSSRPAMQTLTPTLSATVSDADGTAMSVTFEWFVVGASKALGSVTRTSIASGSSTSYTFTSGQLAEGGRYAWRVSASDGTGSSGWTSFCEFSVYVTTPPVEGCQNGVTGDFNGDGVADRVIADPKATVNSLSSAGVIFLIDGGTGATRTLQQGLDGVPDTPESGDRFGHSLTVFDANGDGCADLGIGVPYEDVGTVTDAGAAYLLYGSPQGLGKGPAALTIEQGRDLSGQGRGTVPDAPESSDWFGYAIAGGTTASGEKYLVIGAPGEDVSGATDSGTTHYLRGAINVKFDGQSPQGAETDDRQGFSVAASPYQWAIGTPGEKAGGDTQASGAVCVLNHNGGSTAPTGIRCLVQGDDTNTTQAAEANDQFGKSIAMVPYRPVGAAAGVADSLLVVGVPGEDISTYLDAGLIQQFLITTTGASQLAAINQGTSGLAGAPEEGDYFGEQVVAVNRDPQAEASASTVLVAVGSAGEDLGDTLDAGTIRVFAGGTGSIASSVVVERATNSLPGTSVLQELLGGWLGGDGTSLLVPSPYGNRALYVIPWANLAAGNPTPTVTYVPGQGGLPSSVISFGLSVG